MTIAQEEIFGPVVAVIPYADEEEAIAIANDSAYGLSGSVWSGDESAAADRRAVRTGNIGVNQSRCSTSAARSAASSAPGVGREYGLEGIDEYVELQQLTAPLPQPAASLRRRTSSSSVRRGPVQRRHDLVPVEAVVVVKHEPRAPGTDAAEHRLGAARLVRRQVARHLGHRRRHRVATLLLQLVARQRAEDVRVLVEHTAHLRHRAGQVVHRPRVVPARAAVNSASHAAALWSRSTRVGK